MEGRRLIIQSGTVTLFYALHGLTAPHCHCAGVIDMSEVAGILFIYV